MDHFNIKWFIIILLMDYLVQSSVGNERFKRNKFKYL